MQPNQSRYWLERNLPKKGYQKSGSQQIYSKSDKNSLLKTLATYLCLRHISTPYIQLDVHKMTPTTKLDCIKTLLKWSFPLC